VSEVRVQSEFVDDRVRKVNLDTPGISYDQTIEVASGATAVFNAPPGLLRTQLAVLVANFPEDSEQGYTTATIDDDATGMTLQLHEGEAQVFPVKEYASLSISVTNDSLTDGTARLVLL